jgi:hypothetical protein
MSSTDIRSSAVTPVPRLALGTLAAAVVALAVNTGIALAIRTLDPHGTSTGLPSAAYASLTVLGVLAGTAGWATVRRVATRPRTVLRVLVPAVVVLSLAPDLVLLATGRSAANVVGLYLMHLVVAATTVAVASRTLPLPPTPSQSA